MLTRRSKTKLVLALAILILCIVALLVGRAALVSSPRVVPTPKPTPRKVTGFPITSAVIKDKAGINVEPGMRPTTYYGPNPDGWWCDPPKCSRPSSPIAMIDRELGLIAQLHVGVLRLEFDWPLLEPSRGRYDWSRADAIVLAADRAGIQLQPVLVYTPTWAGPNPTTSPTDSQTWKNFVTRVVSRYKNSVHYWELWNEPDGGGYWIDGTQKYVHTVLIPGYQAVKAADPSAKVLLGAPYYADTTFLNAVYADGGGQSFDIAGFHEYSNVLSPTGVQGDIDVVRHVLDSHSQGGKPIWIGEYGYREASGTTDDSGHIAAMKIMLEQTTGFAEALWYNLRDDEAMTCCPPKTVKIGYWGLVQHDDITLKRSYGEMRRIIAHL